MSVFGFFVAAFIIFFLQFYYHRPSKNSFFLDYVIVCWYMLLRRCFTSKDLLGFTLACRKRILKRNVCLPLPPEFVPKSKGEQGELKGNQDAGEKGQCQSAWDAGYRFRNGGIL